MTNHEHDLAQAIMQVDERQEAAEKLLDEVPHMSPSEHVAAAQVAATFAVADAILGLAVAIEKAGDPATIAHFVDVKAALDGGLDPADVATEVAERLKSAERRSPSIGRP